MFQGMFDIIINFTRWSFMFCLQITNIVFSCRILKIFFNWRGDDLSIYLWDIPQLKDRRYPQFIHHPRWHPLGVGLLIPGSFISQMGLSFLVQVSGARWGPLNKSNTQFIFLKITNIVYRILKIFFNWRGDDLSIYLWDIPQLKDRRYPPFIHHPRWHPLGVGLLIPGSFISQIGLSFFVQVSGARWGPLNKSNTRFIYALYSVAVLLFKRCT